MFSAKLRFASAFLVLASVGGMLASCGKTAAPDETGKDSTAAVTEAETTVPAETEPAFIMPELPAMDFGGRDFTFITSDENELHGVDWVTFDIYAESATGDVIIDAVYDRNMWLEETYNVHIKDHPCVTMKETTKAVQAGVTDYDAVVTAIADGCKMGADGIVLDLQEIPNLDLTQPWWDAGVTKGVSIGGRTFVATGDITVMDNEATWILMFNKQLAKDLDFDFYQMVRDNKWDFETFHSCAQAAVSDLNGDGKLHPADDQYGFATSNDSTTGLIYASGLQLCKKDENDYPSFAGADLEKLTGVVTKAGEIMSDRALTAVMRDPGVETPEILRLMFEAGRSLFYGEVMACVTRMRASETDFGIIPFPKYDLSQDNYYHYVHATAGKGVCIPKTQADTAGAGLLLEAMAAKSVPTVTEAYYDKALTGKYTRDEESSDMLDIILSSRTYDLAYIYNWGNLFKELQGLIREGSTDVASVWDKRISKAEKAMEKTIAAYRDNE